ncbi:MAG: PilT/PilU family type 4a pilus ATPase, partial [Candidatus Omnitrophica bacterium]|nr:PilT/PilU family type 4a pilus ATPase [Candidatus Omnitrophota bacterium]
MNKKSEKQSALESISGLGNGTMELPRKFIGSSGNGDPKSVPGEINLNSSLDDILLYARQQGASDVHLIVNTPITFKKFGSLTRLGEDVVTPEHTKKWIEACLTPEQFSRFQATGDLECVYILDGGGRFRVTLMRERFGWDFTARLIPQTIRSFEDSGMPPSCQKLTKWAQGLVLITGPAGCGKTSTLTTLVEMINASRSDHIITIENPVEMVYEAKQCQITQREIGTHTLSQANALRAALREDPDIIVISELRDLDTIQLAVTAAETGHLVLGTMNTNDAAQTISRLIDSFPPDQQGIIRNMVSESLRGIICQQLVPKKDGSGAVPAFEVLMVNAAIANMIRENKVTQINNAISIG